MGSTKSGKQRSNLLTPPGLAVFWHLTNVINCMRIKKLDSGGNEFPMEVFLTKIYTDIIQNVSLIEKT